MGGVIITPNAESETRTHIPLLPRQVFYQLNYFYMGGLKSPQLHITRFSLTYFITFFTLIAQSFLYFVITFSHWGWENLLLDPTGVGNWTRTNKLRVLWKHLLGCDFNQFVYTYIMLPIGLEPILLSELHFKCSVSAYSTKGAYSAENRTRTCDQGYSTAYPFYAVSSTD